MPDNYPQAPSIALGVTAAQNTQEVVDRTPLPQINGVFPNDKEQARIQDYEYYNKLFLGKHFEAFRIRIEDERYNRAYAKLRYLVVNFAGLLSKIMADMLFSEPPTIKVPEGNQDWVDAWWHANQMDIQCYESALTNSYAGDAVFKLRTGKRTPADSNDMVICEGVSPKLYFPKIDGFNVHAQPEYVDLKWTFKAGDKMYLRVERHKVGLIQNMVYNMLGNSVQGDAGLDVLGIDGLKPEQSTGVNVPLIYHVANWKTADRHFGLSDYHDLDTLFYALNNRMSKVDNILDKHGDPILMVPPGVLDENGKIRKKAMGVMEIEPGSLDGNKPEYIVWDASLENAFKEVEKMVDFLYLTAEISPDLLGLGQGVSDSGRALKFKLMRTLAKASRKRLYYDQALKDMVYAAQVLAKQHGLTADGKEGSKVFTGEPTVPEIDWNDGLPIDNHDELIDAIAAVDAGLQSKRDAIISLYQVDEKAADEMLQEIDDEKPAIKLPTMGFGADANANKDNKNGDKNAPDSGANGAPGKGKVPPQLPPAGK